MKIPLNCRENGVTNSLKYLLDTNVILGVLKQNPEALRLIDLQHTPLHACAYSFITRIELFSFPEINAAETKIIQDFLNEFTYLGMTPNVEDHTIEIRKQYRLKLPDAMISATARAYGLELLSLDQTLIRKH